MTLYIILFILIIILFVPIPIKITASYKENEFHLFLYKKEVYPSKKAKEPKKKSEKDKEKKSGKKKFKINIPGLLSSINNNSFKLKIKIDITGNYFIEDCYYTAILYGIIHQVLAMVNLIISIPFNVKLLKFNINPTFKKQETHLEGYIRCIIYLSLVKVIYILLLLVKNINFGGRLRNVSIRPKPSN